MPLPCLCHASAMPLRRWAKGLWEFRVWGQVRPILDEVRLCAGRRGAGS